MDTVETFATESVVGEVTRWLVAVGAVAGEGAAEGGGLRIGDLYAVSPALVLVLGIILLVPMLVLLGVLWRNRPRVQRGGEGPHTVVVRRQRSGQPNAGRTRTLRGSEGGQRPNEAWLVIEGEGGGQRIDIGHSLVRIGREDDNEIQLGHPTVHRYHAVVQRTEDAEIIITDLSEPHGNGVVINGQRRSEARLRNGDKIEVGAVVLRFGSRPRAIDPFRAAGVT